MACSYHLQPSAAGGDRLAAWLLSSCCCQQQQQHGSNSLTYTSLDSMLLLAEGTQEGADTGSTSLQHTLHVSRTSTLSARLFLLLQCAWWTPRGARSRSLARTSSLGCTKRCVLKPLGLSNCRLVLCAVAAFGLIQTCNAQRPSTKISGALASSAEKPRELELIFATPSALNPPHPTPQPPAYPLYPATARSQEVCAAGV